MTNAEPIEPLASPRSTPRARARAARLRKRIGAVALFGAGVVCGLVVAGGASPAAAADDGVYRKLRVFSQVLSYIQQNYVDEKDTTDLIYDAINGMLTHLDPHTTFLRPSDYEKLREDTAGEFGGLGVEVGEKDHAVIIEVVHQDSPAAHAGLRAGDVVTAVDGEPFADHALDASVRLMRGAPGTRVVLTVQRTGWDATRDIPLVRRQVHIPSVELDDLGSGVAYIRIRAFQERTDHELGQALATARRNAQAKGRSIPAGLVLDLRDDPGGLLDEGVRVADRFLQSGTIVSTQGRTPRASEVETARPDGTEPDYPIAILVNEGTASASEIVAGALQDHKRAVVVGTRTYGKGSVQTLFGLDDGAGLKLTVARYFTPSGRSIQDVGIAPDVPVPNVAVPPGKKGADRLASDPQLKAGLDALLRPPRDLARSK